MKVVAVPPNVRKLIVALLTTLLTSRGEDVTVDTSLPVGWTPASKPHILISLDGTPEAAYPVKSSASVRITAFSGGENLSERLATLCQGLLIHYSGDRSISSIQFLSGALPAKDTTTKAEMSFVAVRVNTRYKVIA